jgi:hypothetical protein
MSDGAPLLESATIIVKSPQTPTEVLLVGIEHFRKRKSDGTTTDQELFTLLGEVTKHLAKLTAVDESENPSPILLAVAEECEKMEGTLGLGESRKKFHGREKTLLERLAAIAEELDDVNGSVQVICETLDVGGDAGTLSKQLEMASEKAVPDAEVVERTVDAILELLERKILPVPDGRLRDKVEALRYGLNQFPFSPGVNLENFIGDRIACA